MGAIGRLSRREAEVLGAMADGLSNEGIAKLMYLSVKSVEAVVRSIYLKLDLFDDRLENRRVRAVRHYLAARNLSHPRALIAVPVSAFVGPVGLIQNVAERIRAGRVMSLVGPGGVGKTRLAREAGIVCATRFPDGQWFVDLVPANTDAEVATVAADCLSAIRSPSGTDVDAVVATLAGRSALIVFDNAEHVVGGVAALAASITESCSTVAVVVTSRQRLGCDGEHVHVVQPLDLSMSHALLAARLTESGVPLDGRGDRSEEWDELCRRMDGLPLALELAAARLRALSVVDILRRADADVDRVPGGEGVQRHRSLDAAISWSFDSLSEFEADVLCVLSVFPASFDVDAAVAVAAAGAETVAVSAVAEAISTLVDQSLVEVDWSALGIRYRLLETIRAFAARRLGPRSEGTRDRHMRHFAEVARAAGERWPGPDQLAVDDLIEAEWDNLRAAIGWATRRGDLAAAEAILFAVDGFANARVRHEHADWARRMVDSPSFERPSAVALATVAWWAAFLGEFATSIRDARRALELGDPLGDVSLASAVGRLAVTLVESGDRDAATALVPELRRIATDHPDPYGRWSALFALANARFLLDPPHLLADVDAFEVASNSLGAPILRARAALYAIVRPVMAGDTSSALAIVENTALPLARAAGCLSTESLCLLVIAGIRGPEPNHQHVRSAVARLFELRHWAMLWMVVETANAHLAATDDLQGASTALGYLDAHQMVTNRDFQAGRVALRDRLGSQPGFERWRAAGAAMTAIEFVPWLLDRLSGPPVDTPPTG